MPINFDFRTVVNKRGSGYEVLHTNELHVVSLEGTFVVSLAPVDVPAPDIRRITVRQAPPHTGVLLTETLILSEVIAGSLKFYIDFATRTVTVDPNLIGTYVYATYSSSSTHVVEEEYTLSQANPDGLCRLQLQEVPLEFPLVSTDTRKISIISDNHGPLEETKTLSEVHTTITKYYVEFKLGRIAFNPALIGDHVQVTYYGTGAIVWAEDIQELQAAIKIMDANVVDCDGSNPLTGDLDMDAHSITNVAPGTVDGIVIATHNHEGGAGQGVILNGENSILTNTIISANLQNKTIAGSGAISTGNIQNNAVTNVELLLDKASLSKVSGGVLNIGGATNETIGVNVTPGISETAQILFRTQVGVSSDKFIFHNSGGGDTCGINIDASNNLNVFCLLTKNIYFRHEHPTLGPINFTVDSLTGDVTVRNNVNTQTGKLQENSKDLIPAGTKMVFYQKNKPLGWKALAPDLDDFALRVVTATGGSSYAGALGYSLFLTSGASAHSVGAHSHSAYTGSSYPSIDMHQYSDIRRSGGQVRWVIGIDDYYDYWGPHYGPGANKYKSEVHTHTINPSVSSATSSVYGYYQGCRYADCIICEKI